MRCDRSTLPFSAGSGFDSAELLDVPLITAWLVNLTHATGGRVIAVGTTATRALESATTTSG